MAQELEHYELTLLAVFCEYQKLTNLVQVKWAFDEKSMPHLVIFLVLTKNCQKHT